MVRDYVTELYLPAARASRALTDGSAGAPGSFAAAKELATWKRRVTRAWGGVAIEHVEALDGNQGPGGKLVVRASIRLGKLTPDDVTVEVVYGRVGDDDEILGPDCNELTVEGPPGEDGVARYAGEAELGRPGPFGYTVRVMPRHRLLASPAELGLVTLPEVPVGMTTGDLR
jgi:starch phosphorylase